MTVDLKALRWMPFVICVSVIVQQSVSFTVYPFLQPLSYLFQGLMVLGFLTMVCITLRRPTMGLFELCTIAFFTLLVIFTFFNGTDLKNSIYISMATWLVLMMFHYYKHNARLLMQASAFALSACVYANIALVLMFPDVIFSAKSVFNSFLLGGNYNQMGSRMIVAVVTSALCVKYGRWWIVNTIMVTLTSVLTLASVGSMTSLAAIGAYAVMLLIPSVQLKKMVAVGYFLFFVFFQVFVVFSGEGLHNNELAVYVIEDVLGKDMSFTGRTIMWDAAARVFAESPIIGYGYVDLEWYSVHMTTFALGPHNFIYNLLIYGGIVLLGLFIVIFAIAIKSLARKVDGSTLNLFLGINTLMVMMLMEIYPVFFIFFLLTLANYYPYLRQSWVCREVEGQPAWPTNKFTNNELCLQLETI